MYAVGDKVIAGEKYSTTFSEGSVLVVSAISDTGRGVHAGPEGHNPALRHTKSNGSLHFRNEYVRPFEVKLGDLVALSEDAPLPLGEHRGRFKVLGFDGDYWTLVEVNSVGGHDGLGDIKGDSLPGNGWWVHTRLITKVETPKQKEEVTLIKEEKMQEHGFARGDRVKVVKKTLACTEEVVGETGFIDELSASGNLRVVCPTRSYYHSPDGLERVAALPEIKVGDTVRLLTNGGYGQPFAAGQLHEVKDVSTGFVKLLWKDGKTLSFYYGSTAGARDEVELVVVKPKERKKADSIAFGDILVGDEIVAYSNQYKEVEIRRKGTVATVQNSYVGTENEVLGWAEDTFYLINRPKPAEDPLADWEKELLDPDFIADGTYWVKNTESGSLWYPPAHWSVVVAGGKASWTAHDADGSVRQTTGDNFGHFLAIKKGTVAGREFLTEDPAVKPKTGFDALDKTKTYFLEERGQADGWYLAYRNNEWHYGDKGAINTAAKQYEEWFTEGTSAWEKPVEWVEPTPEPEAPAPKTLADGYYTYDILSTWFVYLKDGRARFRREGGSWGYDTYEGQLGHATKHGAVPYTPTVEDRMAANEVTPEDRFTRSESAGLKYKVTRKGIVKCKSKTGEAKWYKSASTLEMFLPRVESGEMIRMN